MSKEKKQRATKNVRIYPSDYEVLRRLAFRARSNMAAIISSLIQKA